MHICRFDTVSDLRGKKRTYENIKAAVLKAGKFSVFDVETKRDGIMFTQLCNDPDVEVVKMDYPWTGIRRRTQLAVDLAKPGEDKTIKSYWKDGKLVAVREIPPSH